MIGMLFLGILIKDEGSIGQEGFWVYIFVSGKRGIIGTQNIKLF